MKKQKELINRHYLIKAWVKFVKERDGCFQCQHPWYDGLCEDCNFGLYHGDLIYEIEKIVHDIVNYKDSEWRM